jgi:hypothetical protein
MSKVLHEYWRKLCVDALAVAVSNNIDSTNLLSAIEGCYPFPVRFGTQFNIWKEERDKVLQAVKVDDLQMSEQMNLWS